MKQLNPISHWITAEIKLSASVLMDTPWFSEWEYYAPEFFFELPPGEINENTIESWKN